MFLLYDKLYMASDFKEIPVTDYLSFLVDEIIEIFPAANSIKVMKEIDDFILDVKILQPLLIIINELLTNIMKYVFIGRTDGLISISASLTGNMVSIVIGDNGAGIPGSVDFKISPVSVCSL